MFIYLVTEQVHNPFNFCDLKVISSFGITWPCHICFGLRKTFHLIFSKPHKSKYFSGFLVTYTHSQLKCIYCRKRTIRELIFFINCGLFVLILVVFCVVSSFTTFRPNFTSGLLQVILPRPRIGMRSLVTVFSVITAFHSCCLSHCICPKRSEEEKTQKVPRWGQKVRNK